MPTITVSRNRTSLKGGFFNQFVKANEKENRDAAWALHNTARFIVGFPKPQVSKPGEAPRLVTGRGKESIQVARIPPKNKDTAAEYGIFIAEPHKHMEELQYGNASKNLAPRPWLTIAYNIADQSFRHILQVSLS